MDNFKLFVIVLIGVLVVISLVLLLNPKKPKTFKSRFDELDNCHDICFEKFPFNDRDSVENRQQCMTECLPDLMNKNMSNSNWVDKFNMCVDQRCNLEKCYNVCDVSIIPPMKPERSSYTADEDFYEALDKWEINYANYLESREKCYNDCNVDLSGPCRQKCCENAKMCDSMDTKKMESCKDSCRQVSVKKKC
jgi:hypothetical protein